MSFKTGNRLSRLWLYSDRKYILNCVNYISNFHNFILYFAIWWNTVKRLGKYIFQMLYMSLKAGDHLSRFRLYSGWKRLTLNWNTKRGRRRLSMIHRWSSSSSYLFSYPRILISSYMRIRGPNSAGLQITQIWTLDTTILILCFKVGFFLDPLYTILRVVFTRFCRQSDDKFRFWPIWQTM